MTPTNDDLHAGLAKLGLNPSDGSIERIARLGGAQALKIIASVGNQASHEPPVGAKAAKRGEPGFQEAPLYRLGNHRKNKATTEARNGLTGSAVVFDVSAAPVASGRGDRASSKTSQAQQQRWQQPPCPMQQPAPQPVQSVPQEQPGDLGGRAGMRSQQMPATSLDHFGVPIEHVHGPRHRRHFANDNHQDSQQVGNLAGRATAAQRPKPEHMVMAHQRKHFTAPGPSESGFVTTGAVPPPPEVAMHARNPPISGDGQRQGPFEGHPRLRNFHSTDKRVYTSSNSDFVKRRILMTDSPEAPRVRSVHPPKRDPPPTAAPPPTTAPGPATEPLPPPAFQSASRTQTAARPRSDLNHGNHLATSDIATGVSGTIVDQLRPTEPAMPLPPPPPPSISQGILDVLQPAAAPHPVPETQPRPRPRPQSQPQKVQLSPRDRAERSVHPRTMPLQRQRERIEPEYSHPPAVAPTRTRDDVTAMGFGRRGRPFGNSRGHGQAYNSAVHSDMQRHLAVPGPPTKDAPPAAHPGDDSTGLATVERRSNLTRYHSPTRQRGANDTYRSDMSEILTHPTKTAEQHAPTSRALGSMVHQPTTVVQLAGVSNDRRRQKSILETAWFTGRSAT